MPGITIKYMGDILRIAAISAPPLAWLMFLAARERCTIVCKNNMVVIHKKIVPMKF